MGRAGWYWWQLVPNAGGDDVLHPMSQHSPACTSAAAFSGHTPQGLTLLHARCTSTHITPNPTLCHPPAPAVTELQKDSTCLQLLALRGCAGALGKSPQQGCSTLPALSLPCSKLLVPHNCLNFGSINVQAVKIEADAKRPI